MVGCVGGVSWSALPNKLYVPLYIFNTVKGGLTPNSSQKYMDSTFNTNQAEYRHSFTGYTSLVGYIYATAPTFAGQLGREYSNETSREKRPLDPKKPYTLAYYSFLVRLAEEQTRELDDKPRIFPNELYAFQYKGDSEKYVVLTNEFTELKSDTLKAKGNVYPFKLVWLNFAEATTILGQSETVYGYYPIKSALDAKIAQTNYKPVGIYPLMQGYRVKQAQAFQLNTPERFKAIAEHFWNRIERADPQTAYTEEDKGYLPFIVIYKPEAQGPRLNPNEVGQGDYITVKHDGQDHHFNPYSAIQGRPSLAAGYNHQGIQVTSPFTIQGVGGEFRLDLSTPNRPKIVANS